jgi:hypothetical protein
MLRLLLAPLTLTGSEQDSNAGTTLEMQLVIAVADLVECLREKTAAMEQSKIDYCPVSTIMLLLYTLQPILIVYIS